MKRFITIALLALSVAAVAAVPAFAAGSAGAKKATGEIWFDNTGYGYAVPAHWVFNAIEGSSAKGNVFYEDTFGSYTGKVTAVSMNGHDATVTACPGDVQHLSLRHSR